LPAMDGVHGVLIEFSFLSGEYLTLSKPQACRRPRAGVDFGKTAPFVLGLSAAAEDFLHGHCEVFEIATLQEYGGHAAAQPAFLLRRAHAAS
jgi:hypothetical protein